MRSTRARLLAGLLAGVVLGTIGPVFMAVAWHSGNGSGNEPLTVAARAAEDYVATAGWDLDLWDGDFPLGDVHDHFVEIVAHREAGATLAVGAQDASSAWTGEVIAWSDGVCVDSACYPAGTWRGSIDPAAGNVFAIDPLIRVAQFRGVLVEESTGVPCTFRVGWSTGIGDDTAGSTQDAQVTELRKLTVDVSAMIRRGAYPNVIDAPECWPTPVGGAWFFGAGGTLMGSSSALLQAEDATHGCVRVPDRDRLCWRDV